LISCLGLVALAVLVFRHVDTKEWTITYGKTRGQMVVGATGVTVLLALIGLGLGISSAGQRRNDRPMLSWIGFFVGAMVICLAFILWFLFRARGDLWG
jgi:hypothetical protein